MGQSPKTKTPGSGEKSGRSVGGDHLRRAVLNDSTRRSVSGLMLSPFLSQVSRRSLPGPSSPLRSTSPSSPATGNLVDIVDPVVPLSSPVTKTYSKTGVSPAAKQRENDAFDLMMTGGDVSNSPRIDEVYFQPSSEQNLINFSSPDDQPSSSNTPKRKEDMSTPSTRRSTRMRTPLIKQ